MPYKDIEKRREIHKLNYEKNREKIAIKRANDLLDPVKHAAKLVSQHKYADAHRPEISAYKKIWDEKNNVYKCEQLKKWRAENVDHVKRTRRERYLRTGK